MPIIRISLPDGATGAEVYIGHRTFSKVAAFVIDNEQKPQPAQPWEQPNADHIDKIQGIASKLLEGTSHKGAFVFCSGVPVQVSAPSEEPKPTQDPGHDQLAAHIQAMCSEFEQLESNVIHTCTKQKKRIERLERQMISILAQSGDSATKAEEPTLTVVDGGLAKYAPCDKIEIGDRQYIVNDADAEHYILWNVFDKKHAQYARGYVENQAVKV